MVRFFPFLLKPPNPQWIYSCRPTRSEIGPKPSPLSFSKAGAEASSHVSKHIRQGLNSFISKRDSHQAEVTWLDRIRKPSLINTLVTARQLGRDPWVPGAGFTCSPVCALGEVSGQLAFGGPGSEAAWWSSESTKWPWKSGQRETLLSSTLHPAPPKNKNKGFAYVLWRDNRWVQNHCQNNKWVMI